MLRWRFWPTGRIPTAIRLSYSSTSTPAFLWAVLAGWLSFWMELAKRSCARVTTRCGWGNRRMYWVFFLTVYRGKNLKKEQRTQQFSTGLQRRCHASPSSLSCITPWCPGSPGLSCWPTPGTRPSKLWAPPNSRCLAGRPTSTWLPGPSRSSSLWPSWRSLR